MRFVRFKNIQNINKLFIFNEKNHLNNQFHLKLCHGLIFLGKF